MTDQQPQRAGSPVISSTGVMLAAAWLPGCGHRLCNAVWCERSSVLILPGSLWPVLAFSQIKLRQPPTRNTDIFKRAFSEKQVEVVLPKSQLRGGKTSGRSHQTICERSPTLKSLNMCTQAHICLDAIVGFGPDPGEGKPLQVMKGWSDEKTLRTIL